MILRYSLSYAVLTPLPLMPLYFMERFQNLCNIANHISLQTYWTQPVMSYGRRYRLIWFSDLIEHEAN